MVQYSDHFGRPTLLASIPSTIFGANSKPWPVSKAIISAVISPFKLSGATNLWRLVIPGLPSIQSGGELLQLLHYWRNEFVPFLFKYRVKKEVEDGFINNACTSGGSLEQHLQELYNVPR